MGNPPLFGCRFACLSNISCRFSENSKSNVTEFLENHSRNVSLILVVEECYAQMLVGTTIVSKMTTCKELTYAEALNIHINI